MDRAILEKYVTAGACSPVEIKRSGNKVVVLYGEDRGCYRSGTETGLPVQPEPDSLLQSEAIPAKHSRSF